ncbi:MAG: hypothetical protein IT233_07525 [Bacteroidia bacterium]|nr:hypothetical protein [Bacteroidia bacterium]
MRPAWVSDAITMRYDEMSCACDVIGAWIGFDLRAARFTEALEYLSGLWQTAFYQVR